MLESFVAPYFQTSFFGNINGDDGDSSDPDDSDIEDDSEEEDEGNDSGEADSLDEDEEDEDNEDEDEEGVESGSGDDEDFSGDEEEEEAEESDDKATRKNENKQEIKSKTVAEITADRDSGFDDLPQINSKLKKVKNKTNEKHKQTSVKGEGESSIAKDESSTAALPSIAPPPSSGVRDEYEEDSSDEEDLRNTIGRLGWVNGVW